MRPRTTEDIKKICKDLYHYNSGNNCIAIMGPDGTNTNKLRVYAYGGLLGKIYFGSHSNGKDTLLSHDYLEDPSVLSDLPGTDDCIISSEKYLDLVLPVMQTKYIKKSGKKLAERRIECEIANYARNKDAGWAVIDIEANYPGLYISKGHKVNEQVDLVVLNRWGYGFIELKYNGDSMTNLKKHCTSLLYLQEHPDKAVNSIKNRVEVMDQFDLLNSSASVLYHQFKETGRVPVWGGCLFIGETGKSKKEAGRLLNGMDFPNNFRFSFCDNIRDFDVNDMLPYSMIKF